VVGDVPRSSAEGQKILADLRAMDAQRRRRDDEMSARFAEHDRQIAALLERERAAVHAQVAAQPVDDAPAIIPEPIEGLVPQSSDWSDNPPAAEDITAADFAAWRAAHIHQDLGIFT